MGEKKENCSQAGYKGKKNGIKNSRKVPVVREFWLRISCRGKKVQ